MRCQRIAGKQRVDIPRVDQFGKRASRIVVERNRRSEHPHDLALLAIMPQHVIQLVIILGKRGFPGAVLTKRKHVAFVLPLAKAVRMHPNALACVLGSAAKNQIALFEMPEFHHLHRAVFPDRHTVHAAFGGKTPLPGNFEVFGKDAHGVIAFRRNKVRRTGNHPCVRRRAESLFGKIGGVIGTKRECHNCSFAV